MNDAATLVRKDLRMLWPLAVFVAATLLLDQIVASLGFLHLYLPDMPATEALELGLSAFRWPAIIVFATAIVQADPRSKEAPFWRTRPLSASTVVGAKIATILLLVALPAALARAFGMAMLGVQATTAVGIVIESVVTVCLWAFSVALLAALTKSVLQMLMSVVCLFALFVVLGMLCAHYYPHAHISTPWDSAVPENGPRIFAAESVWLIGCIVLLYAHYVRLGRLLTVALVAVLFFVSFEVGIGWRRGTASAPRPPQIADLPDSDAAALEVGLTKPAVRAADGDHYMTLSERISVSGLQGGQEAKIHATEYFLTPLKPEERSFHIKVDRDDAIDWVSEPDYLRWMGEPGLAAHARARTSLPYSARANDGESLPAGSTYSGSLRMDFTFRVSIDQILFRLPLRKGAVGGHPGQRWIVESALTSQTPPLSAQLLAIAADKGQRWIATLRSEKPQSLVIPASPFAQPWPTVDRFILVAPDSDTYSFAIHWGGDKNDIGLSGYRADEHYMSVYGVVHKGVPVFVENIDPKWFDHAELVAIHSTPTSRTSASTQLPVDLLVAQSNH